MLWAKKKKILNKTRGFHFSGLLTWLCLHYLLSKNLLAAFNKCMFSPILNAKDF